MEEKIDEVIGQYGLRVLEKRRVRGGILLETDDGFFTLTGYKENLARLSFTEQVKQELIEQGYLYVDQGIRNINGEWLTKDHMGDRWHMKRWHAGKECNLSDEVQVQKAAAHLAALHRLLVMGVREELPLQAAQTEHQIINLKEAGSTPPANEQEAISDFADRIVQKNMEATFERRTKEMRRVYNYVKQKKRKNDMEIRLLNLFSPFSEQAEQAVDELKKIGYRELLEDEVNAGKIFHGSYSYHNVLFGENGKVITTNFEKSAYGIQIVDLYDFLRKFLEKNNWEIHRGIRVLNAYMEEKPLEKREGAFLYILLSFPEKFWKQMNFYYNGKKSWMSMKNLDKIRKIEQQEENRRKFLKEAKRVLI